MRVVVTGGAGFIGANLCRALVGEADVVVVDDLSTGSAANLDGLEVERIDGSVTDAAVLADAFRGADAVVHLAARASVPRSIEHPFACHDNNVTGTLQVLLAARDAGDIHTIVASSSSVYGANPTLPKHEGLRCEPLSPYAASKLATEGYAAAFAECYALPVLTLRFFNVFGPLQPANHAYAAVIPAFLAAALADRPLQIHGDGLQSRDFTYVGSLAAVLIDALRRRVTYPEPVNLAFGSRHTLLEVVGELEAVLGKSLAVEHGPVRVGDVRHSQADTTRLETLFPDAAPVAFRDGLAATAEWFRSQSDV